MGWAASAAAGLTVTPRRTPPPLTRLGEQAAARRELAKNLYARDRPSLEQRILTDVYRWLGHLLDRAASPTGAGAIILLVVVIAVLVVLRARLGPLRTSAGGFGAETLSGPLPAATYRAQAAAAAREGNWAGAMLAAMRGLSRGLEERGVLEPMPSRTAHELVAVAALAFPGERGRLASAADAFTEVAYGGRPAGQGGYQAILAADQALQRERPAGLAALSVPTPGAP